MYVTTFIEYHNLIFVQKLLYNASYCHCKILNLLYINQVCNIITSIIEKTNFEKKIDKLITIITKLKIYKLFNFIFIAYNWKCNTGYFTKNYHWKLKSKSS